MLDPKKIILTQIFEGGGGGGGDVEVEPLSITANGTYTAETGKAYSPVSVSVPNSYAAGDEGKVVSNGALVSQTSGSVTQNGTVDTTLINSLLVNVSGGGGASNIVTGTFTGTTNSSAIDIDVSYSGTGHPIALIICPTEGPFNSASGTFHTLVQENACACYVAVKSRLDTAPLYSSSSNDDDFATISQIYKSSSSDGTSRQVAFGNTRWYRDANASSGGSGGVNICRCRSNKKLTVYIAGSNSYGFAKDIEYTYRIIYSS